MKKLMMSKDEYYNRKKVDDYLDEQISSHEGCRNLAVFFIVFTILMAVAIIFMTW